MNNSYLREPSADWLAHYRAGLRFTLNGKPVKTGRMVCAGTKYRQSMVHTDSGPVAWFTLIPLWEEVLSA